MTGVKGRRWPANIYVDDSIDDYAIPYKGPGGVLLWLSPGAANQVVASSGTSGPIGYADQSGGSGGGGSGSLVLLESHIASASASLDFTTRNASGQSGATIQSDFNDYEIRIVNIIPETDNVDFRMRVSTDGGLTFITTNSYSWLIGTQHGATTDAASATGVAFMQFGNSYNNTANWSVTGRLQLCGPGSALYKAVIGEVMGLNAGARFRWTVSGLYEATTAVNAVRFYFSSGNIASGTIRVYGVAK